jgi:hypothetical protein
MARDDRFDNSGIDLSSNKKLDEQKAIKLLADGLGDIKRLFLYGGVSNNTLRLTFSSPAGASEFNSKRDRYIAEFRKIYKEQNLKELIYFQNIEVVSVFRAKQKGKKEVYIDRAKGEFINKAKNPKIYKMFEEIRGAIRCGAQDV